MTRLSELSLFLFYLYFFKYFELFVEVINELSTTFLLSSAIKISRSLNYSSLFLRSLKAAADEWPSDEEDQSGFDRKVFATLLKPIFFFA